MRLVSQALDILQCEEKVYLSMLLPTIAMCLKQLRDMKESKKIKICLPLLNALLQGIEIRFSPQIEDDDCRLAAAFHLQFKLHWVDWLGDAYQPKFMKACISNLMLSLLKENEVECLESSSDTDPEGKSDDFFGSFASKGNEENQTAKNKLDKFLKQSQRKGQKNFVFPDKNFKDLFLKFNTAIPSSAAVEKIFSLGKDILKPKRSELSDAHFEMLVFLKGN